MSTADMSADGVVSVCANCGKEGNDVNNICNKCKMVRYCNAACKKKHRHKHKKECEEHARLVAERAAELHDEELFKQPPLLHENCPICFLRMPSLGAGSRYQSCCGKVICTGCLHAPVYDSQGNEVDKYKCPFCRVPVPSSEAEGIKRMKKRVETGDSRAMFNLAFYYYHGLFGLPQDYRKALELWHQACELGFVYAYNYIGVAYDWGRGVEVDTKKAIHYTEQAAMRGDETARYSLGTLEKNKGNMDKAVKHYMIAIKDGDSDAVNQMKELYSDGHATKDDYTKALQSYQEYLGEIKSEQRDQAAAAYDDYRYY